MPRPRFQKLAPAVQHRILEAAAEEFAARGFHEASYNQIIEASGVSKGSFYYYFDDKADLFVTVLEGEWERAGEGMAGLWIGEVSEAPFWEQVEALMVDFMQRAARHPRALTLAKASMAMMSAHADNERLQRFMAEGLARTASVLEIGRGLGAVREDLPPDLLAAAVFGLGEALDRYLFASEAALDEAALAALPALYTDLMRRLAAP